MENEGVIVWGDIRAEIARRRGVTQAAIAKRVGKSPSVFRFLLTLDDCAIPKPEFAADCMAAIEAEASEVAA